MRSEALKAAVFPSLNLCEKKAKALIISIPPSPLLKFSRVLWAIKKAAVVYQKMNYVNAAKLAYLSVMSRVVTI